LLSDTRPGCWWCSWELRTYAAACYWNVWQSGDMVRLFGLPKAGGQQPGLLLDLLLRWLPGGAKQEATTQFLSGNSRNHLQEQQKGLFGSSCVAIAVLIDGIRGPVGSLLVQNIQFIQNNSYNTILVFNSAWRPSFFQTKHTSYTKQTYELYVLY
jgi:hypothetical protein